VREGFVAGEDDALATLADGASEIFGFGPKASVRGDAVELGGRRAARFR
jgi:hypothetical protein